MPARISEADARRLGLAPQRKGRSAPDLPTFAPEHDTTRWTERKAERALAAGWQIAYTGAAMRVYAWRGETERTETYKDVDELLKALGL